MAKETRSHSYELASVTPDRVRDLNPHFTYLLTYFWKHLKRYIYAFCSARAAGRVDSGVV